ncbi:hypothetical protein DFJ77DRAFT_457951 [Powellomyces hirtus]|nr:hypothetical protein DFJ77DRAFT_457951 [Powellomyces hirtus]
MSPKRRRAPPTRLSYGDSPSRKERRTATPNGNSANEENTENIYIDRNMKEKTITRHGREVMKPTSYFPPEADEEEEEDEMLSEDSRLSTQTISRRPRGSVSDHNDHMNGTPTTPVRVERKRLTRNSLATEAEVTPADLASVTGAYSPTAQNSEVNANGADGDDENDNEERPRRARRPRILYRPDSPVISRSTRTSKRKVILEDEEEEQETIYEQSRYSLRSRPPQPTEIGKRKSAEIVLDPSLLLNTSRSMRNRPQIDYNEGRTFGALYRDLNNQSGPGDSRSWHSPEPRRLPMANTVGGGVYGGHDSEEEDTLGKPLLQYARCTSLLKALPDEERAVYKERLQLHLDGNDFPSLSTSLQNKVTFDMIGGHEEHIKTVQEMIKIALLYPELTHDAEPLKGVMFYGPPGNGKTLMARAIASSCSTYQVPVSFFECHASDIHSKWFGDSEKHLKKLFDDAKANEPSIIFFDEIDGIVPARSSGENATPHNSVVTSLLTLMDGLENRGRVIVIGATNRLDTLDPALLRPGRFDRRLQFKRPNLEARKKIINIKAKTFGLPDGLEQQLAATTDGYSGADLKSLCSDAYYKALRRTYPQIYTDSHKLQIDPGAIKVTERDFYQALRDVKPSASAADSMGHPPSVRVQNLISQTWEVVAAKLNLIWKALSRRTIGAAGSTLQPRMLLYGAPKMGQAQIASTASNQLIEWGFRLETVRRSTDSELLEFGIMDKINSLRLEPSPALFIPSIDTWSDEAVQCLDDQLETAGHPIFVLATWEREAPLCSMVKHFVKGDWQDINSLLGYRSLIQMKVPTREKRQEFFSPIITSVAKPPDVTALAVPPTALAVLPLAPTPPLPVLTSAERKAFDEKCWYINQDLKQRLRSFYKVVAKTKYRVFCQPVDLEKYPDYLEIVSNPLDMGDMMQKVDSDHYETPEMWLQDIEQIHDNVKAYNEAKSDIVHKVCEFLDEARQFVQMIPSKYKLNYLQVSLWKRAGGTHDVVQSPMNRSPTVSPPKGKAVYKRRKLSSGSTTDGIDTGINPGTNNTTSTTSPGPAGPSMMDIDVPCLTSPPRPLFSPLDAPHPQVSDAELRTLETRLLNVTDGMDVRNLEVLYQVLEGEIEAMEGETDRSIVLMVTLIMFLCMPHISHRE